MTKQTKTDFTSPPLVAPKLNEKETQAEPLSVSALAQQIKKTVENQFSSIAVRGEIGRVSRPASGHIYLDLKDEQAVLSAVIWRGQAKMLSHQPEEGLEAVCKGRLTTYGAQSRYQLIIEDLAPAGKGALMALIEERRKKFAALGLFDKERKKPLPYLPRRIGIITSPSGAVIRDILHRLEERFGREVLLWGVQVQGKSCPDEVAAAIEGFNGLPKDQQPDLLIVARGGGSLEDLYGFNEEAVVMAASRSTIPLISAIGHETDHTLLDLVADLRAPTPTAAAERAVPVRLEEEAKVQGFALRLNKALQHAVQIPKQRLEDVSARLRPLTELVYRLGQRIDDLTQHLPAALQNRLQLARQQLVGINLAQPIKMMLKEKKAPFKQVASLLDALSYQRTLERGFALVLDEKGKLVKQAKDTSVGQNLEIEFAHSERIDVQRVSPKKQKGLFDG